MSEPTTGNVPSVNPPQAVAIKLNKDQAEWIASQVAEGPVMIAEYRGEGTEIIKFTDKKTGAAQQFTKHSLALEFGTIEVSQMTCDIDYARGVEPVPTGYKKGQQIVLVLSGLIKTRDHFAATCSKHRAL